MLLGATRKVADSVVAFVNLRDASGALLTGRVINWSVADSTIVQPY
ncbi:MAG: hypothetical protein HYX65_03885 [Gemmatimonadetes bacterium]|nr:hypothetical protein [Gemmatimonadota bacterium]